MPTGSGAGGRELPPCAAPSGQPRFGHASQLPVTGGVTRHHGYRKGSRPSWHAVPASCATAIAMRGMARSIALPLLPHRVRTGLASASSCAR
jgi:hypothetical protein